MEEFKKRFNGTYWKDSELIDLNESINDVLDICYEQVQIQKVHINTQPLHAVNSIIQGVINEKLKKGILKKEKRERKKKMNKKNPLNTTNH